MFDRMCFFIYNKFVMDEKFEQIVMDGIINEREEESLSIFDVNFYKIFNKSAIKPL